MDGWIPSYGFAPPGRAFVMRERVLAAARRADRDPADITCAYHLLVHVGDQADPGPGVIAGSAEAVAERLTGFVGLGFTAMSFAPVGPDPREQAERLAGEVIPAVRAAASLATPP